MFAVEVGGPYGIGCQLGLILLAATERGRAGSRDQLEVGRLSREWLTAGPDEPCLGLTARL